MQRTFECYAVIEPLGTGGMGSVFKAHATRLNRLVALKRLRGEFAEEASFAAKLHEEVRRTASINHPHVVEVYSVGQDHKRFYVVMELVDGAVSTIGWRTKSAFQKRRRQSRPPKPFAGA